ncbi:citramalate synthase [Luteolibacter flavescens]|uniref:Citramalate synthase n=1 Tax=Luteolibacter flavescens TaxID=1859460 RepID=A0ABT3FJ75_9BACT|nr:citramalate synthase [Luteolibacter flavescens]MCW1883507.1 citramalate synthase [Luteolibacter flavescens]
MSVLSDKPVRLYDTTLRDGTQGEGFQLSLLDKLRISERLDAFGIDYIEGGWPGSNPKDVEFFQEAKKLKLSHAKLAAFGSTRRAGIPVEQDPQVKLLLDAETPVVTIFGKSWEMQVTEVLRTTPEENRAMIRDTVAYLKQHGREVVYDAEHFFDGYKDSPGHALGSLQAAAEGGADCLVLCDTNGGTLPEEVMEICQIVRARIPQVPVGIHTHNDCELAVANAIAAVKGGAVQVQGTINGYGERTGNCNLTSVIPILQLKMDLQVVPDLTKLRELSYFVDDVSNNPHFARAAFVGRTAFAHKGGMHVNAVQKLARSYEHIEPQAVGNEQNILVSELSGQSNILIKAEQMGIPLDKGSAEAKAVLQRVKELENEGYAFEAAGGSLDLLIRRELGRYEKPFDLKEFHTSFRQYRDGHEPVCEATVKLYVGEVPKYTVAEGHGVVNALDKALREALAPFYPEIANVSLVDYKVRIIDGHDATAAKTRVLIVSSDGTENWGTVGVSENIIEASWIALVDGIDLFLQRRRGN